MGSAGVGVTVGSVWKVGYSVVGVDDSVVGTTVVGIVVVSQGGSPKAVRTQHGHGFPNIASHVS